MTHKSRIWRDIDKHPLPTEDCLIDVKLSCGSMLIEVLIEGAMSEGRVLWTTESGSLVCICHEDITQWRYAK